jgi:hypothetical protein
MRVGADQRVRRHGDRLVRCLKRTGVVACLCAPEGEELQAGGERRVFRLSPQIDCALCCGQRELAIRVLLESERLGVGDEIFARRRERDRGSKVFGGTGEIALAGADLRAGEVQLGGALGVLGGAREFGIEIDGFRCGGRRHDRLPAPGRQFDRYPVAGAQHLERHRPARGSHALAAQPLERIERRRIVSFAQMVADLQCEAALGRSRRQLHDDDLCVRTDRQEQQRRTELLWERARPRSLPLIFDFGGKDRGQARSHKGTASTRPHGSIRKAIGPSTGVPAASRTRH